MSSQSSCFLLLTTRKVSEMGPAALFSVQTCPTATSQLVISNAAVEKRSPPISAAQLGFLPLPSTWHYVDG
jgi:hypothetical protein